MLCLQSQPISKCCWGKPVTRAHEAAAPVRRCRPQRLQVAAQLTPKVNAAAAVAPPASDAAAQPATFVPRPVTSVLDAKRTELARLFQLSGDLAAYAQAERQFTQLLNTEDLDEQLRSDSQLQDTARQVQEAVQSAVAAAYETGPESGETATAAHLFLQRVLYRINRMVLFWYDDLRNYSNERSMWLAQLRDSIERPWQAWELAQLDVAAYQAMTPDQIKEAVRAQAAHDVDPPLSEPARYMRETMSREGYRHLLAMASVDGLVEASRQSRVCGGAANEVMCAVFRVLMEEYGTGRYNKKHSTFFATMMRELDLSTEPEFYFDLVPWQSLAAMNHNFLLTERRRHYLRYLGGLTFFEVAGPSIYRTYLAAARRLGLSEGAAGYWELHIKEDERHGRQMVEDVAVPLVDKYPKDAWEVVLGYDQEKSMGERAGAAAVASIRVVDQQQHTPAADMV